MKRRDISESSSMRIIIALCDMVVLSVCLLASYMLVYNIFPDKVAYMNVKSYVLLAILCYVPISLYFPPVFLQRVIRGDRIVERCFLSALTYIAFFVTVLFLMRGAMISRIFVLAFYLSFSFGLSLSHMVLRGLVKSKRSSGSNQHHVLLVGATDELQDLYENLSNREYGVFVDGVFTEDDATALHGVKRLGDARDVLSYVKEHPMIDAVYCSLSSIDREHVMALYRYCENSITRFYVLPAYVNTLRRNMVISTVGSTVMLSARPEPLQDLGNRIIKRAFDIVISIAFLLTLFPIIYLVVAILIKRQSPGPVFFFQKRSGLNGREFECIKFRSMHLNDDADLVQATENDSRKFRFGDFMRRMNIDELPQFLNVLRGDMSIVGPGSFSPRVLEAYRGLADQYTTRHWTKPGITGWAQIHGSCGEISEATLMSDRVHCDIWYVENWSFWLDIRIIYRTLLNMILHNDKNAY